jgi:hypothetical protein
MPQRRSRKFASLVLATVWAVTALLGAVSMVLADGGGIPYPK